MHSRSADPDDDLLRPFEVAEVLGVTTILIARCVRKGILRTHTSTMGGHRRYRRADVIALRVAYRDAIRLYAQGWSLQL